MDKRKTKQNLQYLEFSQAIVHETAIISGIWREWVYIKELRPGRRPVRQR